MIKEFIEMLQPETLRVQHIDTVFFLRENKKFKLTHASVTTRVGLEHTVLQIR